MVGVASVDGLIADVLVASPLAKKMDRLATIAQNAAEQSHRNLVPEVTMYAKLSDVGDDAAVKLVAYEESAKKGEHAALVSALVPHPASLCVVFGPEGGISPAELALLQARGFTPAGLGPRILRTETARNRCLCGIRLEKRGASADITD